jgi:hypothetical protein
MGQVFYGGASFTAPKNWNYAFNILTQAIYKQQKGRKKILFFDELPWMAKKNLYCYKI